MLDRSFDRAQFYRDNYLPPEPKIAGECEICGDVVYAFEIEQELATPTRCQKHVNYDDESEDSI